MAGGQTEKAVINMVEIYNPQLDQWEPITARMSTPRDLILKRKIGTGKGACPHIGRSLRIATRSNPLVARSTALLFSRRCLRCS